MTSVVGERYAQALYEAAGGPEQAREAGRALAQVWALIERNPGYLALLSSPAIAQRDRQQAVRTAFSGRAPQIVCNFLLLLIEKHRISRLPEIVRAYEALVRRADGICRATVVTAVPMEAGEMDRLRARLTRLTGRQIALVNAVDPAVLGGACVRWGSRQIDGTVRTGLRALAAELCAAEGRECEQNGFTSG